MSPDDDDDDDDDDYALANLDSDYSHLFDLFLVVDLFVGYSLLSSGAPPAYASSNGSNNQQTSLGLKWPSVEPDMY